MFVKNICLSLLVTVLSFSLISCSHEDEVMRTYKDIEGIWQLSDTYYLSLNDDNSARILLISEQDGETIGSLSDNVYFYEPGYNLVVYLDFPNDVEVYQVLKLTPNMMQWCWVKSLKDKYEEGDEIGEIGEILGEIINEAQAGFHLDPELYQTFHRISEERYLEILDNINILGPWEEP